MSIETSTNGGGELDEQNEKEAENPVAEAMEDVADLLSGV